MRSFFKKVRMMFQWVKQPQNLLNIAKVVIYALPFFGINVPKDTYKIIETLSQF